MNTHELSDFLRAPAPPAMWRMPYRATNCDFIQCLHIEGVQIRQFGDSILTSFDFTADDVAALEAASRQGHRALEKGMFDDGAVQSFRLLPAHMRAVATYYEQKAAALTDGKKTAKFRLDAGWGNFRTALACRDYETLVDFYPHKTSLVYDDDDKTDVPHDNETVRSLLRARMVRAFAEAAKENERAAEPLPFTHIFGRPETLEKTQAMIVACQLDIERNTSVLEAVGKVADGLERIFAPPEPKPAPESRTAQIIPFRVPSLLRPVA